MTSTDRPDPLLMLDLAQTGAAEQGAYLALLIALGYTTVSAAVTFPLLLMRGTRLFVPAREVSR